jgi:dihydroxyacetone kinase-like predicted kinase
LPAAVVATQAPAQALAALAVYDAFGPLVEVHARMAAAAAATRYGAVVPAPGELEETGSPEGVLGLVGGRVVTSGTDALAVAETVVVRLLDEGGELLTVLTGAGSEAPTLAAALSRQVQETAADVDVHLLDCGQEGPLLLLGVE